MKVAIGWGGFGLSDAAYERLIELGVPVVDDESEPEGLHIFRWYDDIEEKTVYFTLRGEEDYRSHPLLIQVIEELGAEAEEDDPYALLQIVQVPDDVDWYIEEHEGAETIHEVHRTWP